MKLPMPEPIVKYAEDFSPGEEFDLGEYVVDEAEIIRFASEYDPLPFHVDKTTAEQSIYGGLTASGWHTGLIMMRLMYYGFLNPVTGMGSPGFEELRWLKPVRPNDRLRGHLKVEDVRISRSKPGMGFVTNTAWLCNQDGVEVYRVRNVGIFKTRAADKAA